MNDPLTSAGHGIRFFGKVTASLSHELNNVLAAIYENAGLVEDLLCAAEKGRPLDPGRLKDLASRVRTQVRRGRDIVQNMNRFAHSADEPRRSIDLSELLNLLVDLARRTASMHEVVLEPQKAENPVVVKTDPFLLQNLVWLCLDFILTMEGPSRNIRLVPESNGDEACIRFTGLNRMPDGAVFPTQAQQILCEALGARLSMSKGTGEIILSIPKDAGNGKARCEDAEA
jgi:signal transduction histidine kinase